MPNSTSNKLGFYDEPDLTETKNQHGSDKTVADANKPSKGAKNKTTPNETNDNSKRFVENVLQL